MKYNIFQRKFYVLSKFQNKYSKISLIKESLSPMKIKESKEKL